MENTLKKKQEIFEIHKIFAAFAMLTMVFCFLPAAYANNLVIEKVSLSGQTGTKMQAGDTIAKIQFDISQNNSWRFSPQLYDAAWVFVKYSLDGVVWKHATIASASPGPVDLSSATGTGLTYTFPSDKKGIFIFRSGESSGTLSTSNIKLIWDIAADGVNPTASKVVLKVFGLEMVYIPQGAFYAGSGGTTADKHFYKSPNKTDTYLIDSEDALKAVTVAGSSTCPDGGLCNTCPDGELCFDISVNDNHGQIPAGYPKGYKAFYIMKYELTQGQYRDFLNTLTRTQQATATSSNQDQTASPVAVNTTTVTNRFVLSNTSTVSYRNGIRCAATISATDPVTFYCDLDGDGIPNEPGDATNPGDGEFIACNFMSGTDVSAYADWAGLRPMTELELEKAARGTAQPVLNEYAWGTSTNISASSITNSGKNNETSNGNFSVAGGSFSPLRSGFAATSTSSRSDAGASFYGVMELSGNLMDTVINISRPEGRSFIGSVHGDGALRTAASGTSLAGNTDINWPGNSWDNWGGMSTRGNTYISNRGGVSNAATFSRSSQAGIRCVRTAPQRLGSSLGILSFCEQEIK